MNLEHIFEMSFSYSVPEYKSSSTRCLSRRCHWSHYCSYPRASNRLQSRSHPGPEYNLRWYFCSYSNFCLLLRVTRQFHYFLDALIEVRRFGTPREPRAKIPFSISVSSHFHSRRVGWQTGWSHQRLFLPVSLSFPLPTAPPGFLPSNRVQG